MAKHRYLVKMTPLEPYTFGTDQGFSYSGEESCGKVTYFAKTAFVPAQTTILGLLRYLVLAGDFGGETLLKADFKDYTKEDINKNGQAVGTDSFAFGEKLQDFGKIKSISPVFLMQGKDIYIKNPFNNTVQYKYKSELVEKRKRESLNNKDEADKFAIQLNLTDQKENEDEEAEFLKGFEPIKLMDKEIETSYGKIKLPVDKEYSAKIGHGYGYININNKAIDEDIFKICVFTGNRKNECNENREEAFFKKEAVNLKKNFCFAVYVDIEMDSEHPIIKQKDIGYMGYKRSAFEIEILLQSEEDCMETETAGKYLENKIEAAFKNTSSENYYALSELYVEKQLEYNSFCIVEEKYQRNLQTIYEEENGTGKYRKRYKKNLIRVNLIEAGSVFYEDVSTRFNNENAKKIGYNSIVKLGGN